MGLSSDINRVGIGVVIHNHDGQVLASMSETTHFPLLSDV